jgi:subtilisin family serine protease
MRRWGSLLAIVALAGGCAGDPMAPPTSESPSAAVSGDGAQTQPYIVVFQPNTVDALSVSASLEQRHQIRAVRYRYERAIQGFAADLTPGQVQGLAADPRVQYMEPDGVMTITATQNNPPSWGLDRIDQRNLPLSMSYTYPTTAPAVHLYGIDTGILYGHADFGGRATAGFDAISPPNGAVDCNGHGTHTASTAAGTTYGVAKGMAIVGVRVLNCSGSGTTSGVIAGVDWVRINAIKPAVANMSLGGGLSTALNNAVANAIASGVVFSVSAGNNNGNACNQSPAATPTALTIGSTTITDARSSFSNFGTCLDLFAPGSNIRAAYIPSGSAVLSGTSMSAPHVAGVVGLYLQQNPNATPAQVATALINNATTGVVTSPGTGSPNRLLYMGFLNGGGTNQPPVAVPAASCNANNFCTFDATGSTDDVGITGYEWRGPSGSLISTAAVFTRQFSSNAQRTYTLTVFDGGGLSDSEPITFLGSGNQAPVAVPAFTCAAGGSCTFDATGSTDDVGVTRYEWRGPSGSLISTAAVFTRQFTTPATRTYTLIVFDAGGLSDSETFSFTSLP